MATVNCFTANSYLEKRLSTKKEEHKTGTDIIQGPLPALLTVSVSDFRSFDQGGLTHENLNDIYELMISANIYFLPIIYI